MFALQLCHAILLRIITFHTDDDLWMREPHPIGGIKAPFTEPMPLFMASARRFHPHLSLEIITDQTTELPHGFDVVWRRDIDQSALMLDRARAQEELTRDASRGDVIVFLDTDTLILRNPRHVFDASFDVGMTIRHNPMHDFERRMPYNNGVIFRLFAIWCGGIVLEGAQKCDRTA